MLSGLLLGCVFILPWIQPTEYWVPMLRQEPLASLTSALVAVAMLLGLAWVYRALQASPVLAARAQAGQKVAVPKSAFIAGGALAVIMAVLLQFTLKGEAAEKAVRLAAEQYGAEYKYFVSSINWAGGHVSARLIAYNRKESREIEVEWDD